MQLVTGMFFGHKKVLLPDESREMEILVTPEKEWSAVS